MAKKKAPKLTREMILSANDIKRETVPVPEWGEGAEVTVTTWPAKTRDHFDFLLKEEQAKGNEDKDVRGLIIYLSVIDAKTGERLFTLDDIAALGQKSQTPINRIFQAATRLNPLFDQPVSGAAKN